MLGNLILKDDALEFTFIIVIKYIFQFNLGKINVTDIQKIAA